MNLTGAYLCTRQVVAGMRAAGVGRIVNVASVNARFGGSPLSGPAYAASKGGLLTLSRFLALHHAADQITVNAVAPGPHDTPMWHAARPRTARAHPGDGPRRRARRPRRPGRGGGVPVRAARRLHHRRHHRRKRRPVDGLATDRASGACSEGRPRCTRAPLPQPASHAPTPPRPVAGAARVDRDRGSAGGRAATRLDRCGRQPGRPSHERESGLPRMQPVFTSGDGCHLDSSVGEGVSVPAESTAVLVS